MCKTMLAVAAVGIGIALCASTVGAQSTQPNILIFLADDLGISDLSPYGGEINTPSLSQMATDGVKFTNYYVQPRCSPTRAAILTGHQNHKVGFSVLSGGGTPLTMNHVTLPEVLQANGYSTYMSGKWHLGRTNNFGTIAPTIPGNDNIDPRVRGFDHAFTFTDSHHSKDNWLPGQYRVLTNSGIPQPTTRYIADTDGVYEPQNNEFYQTDAIGDYALDFLQHHRNVNTLNGTDKPFFQYVAFGAPHFPLQAPKALVDQYVATYQAGWDALRADRLQGMINKGVIPSDVVLTPRSDVPPNNLNGEGLHQLRAWDTLAPDRQADLVRRMAIYAAMVEIVDQNVGRIMTDLQSNGELDNTIVMFMTDNGADAEWHDFGKRDTETIHTGAALANMGTAIGNPDVFYGTGWANAGSTPYRNYKHYTHEGGIKSPLLLQWGDGLDPSLVGAIRDDLTHVTDIMPTLLDIAGVTMPTQWTALNGTNYNVEPLDVNVKSWENLLTNATAIGEREFGVEHEGNRAYRIGDWKLVSSNFTGTDGTLANEWELYNLADDPTEINNLSASRPDKLQELVNAYNQWAFRNGVISSLPPTPPAPLLSRSNDLFLDNFTRSNNTDADADDTGMSGADVPPLGANATYHEGWEGSGQPDSIMVTDTMLQMATGNGMSENGIDHNFVDQAILDNGGFMVGLEAVLINSAQTDTSNRFIGFAVGLTDAEAQAGDDINDNNNGTSFRSSRGDFMVEIDLNNNVKAWSEGVRVGDAVNVGTSSGRLEAMFFVDSFNAGQSVQVAIFFDGVQLDMDAADPNNMNLSFQWDESLANYLGLSARASALAQLDNFRVNTLLQGDTNLDDKVSLLDLNALGAHFGTNTGWAGGDFNGDGTVSLIDLNLLGANFGQAVTLAPQASPAVPEPASLALLLVGGVTLLRRRR